MAVGYSQRLLRRTLIGALISLFLLVNLITPPLLDSHIDWLAAVVLGICIGQVNLIAAWAALAPGSAVFRLPWSVLLGVLMWYALILGFRLSELLDWLGLLSFPSDLNMGEAVLLGVVLVVGIVVAQIPLWIAGRIFRWKLVSGEIPDDHHRQQFNLRHLLLGIFVLSMVLGAARVILPTERPWNLPVEQELFSILGAVFLCNLLITVPCIWGSFAPTTKMFPLAGAWTVYCALLTAAEIGVLCLFLGTPGSGLGEVFTIFSLLNLSQCGTVLGTFLLLRRVGFRFVRLPIEGKPLVPETSQHSPFSKESVIAEIDR